MFLLGMVAGTVVVLALLAVVGIAYEPLSFRAWRRVPITPLGVGKAVMVGTVPCLAIALLLVTVLDAGPLLDFVRGVLAGISAMLLSRGIVYFSIGGRRAQSSDGQREVTRR